jgi:hypothetical protein
MSAYAAVTERNKHKLFVCRGLQKKQTLEKNVREKDIYS